MALHFTLKVNAHSVGVVEIRRLSPLGAYREVYTYEVTTLYRSQRLTGTFQHTYSDGALVCIRKALEAVTSGALSPAAQGRGSA